MLPRVVAGLPGPSFKFSCAFQEVRMKSVRLLFLLLCASAITWAQSSPSPMIDLPLVPSSAVPGGPGFTLTLNGAGFVSGSVVKWNGHARTTQFVSKARLTAAIPASDIAKAGTASVTVTTPGAANPSSNAAFFSVVTPVATVAFTGSSFPTFGHPWEAITGDFNEDGVLDLAVANWETNLAVLLGKGDGTFQSAITNPGGRDSGWLATGDFNGDGKLDLAVTNAQGTNVSVLLGNGDGTFQRAVDYTTGSNPNEVVVADFNGDGKLDLVVAAESQLSILLGNGDGTFQMQKTIVSGFGEFICTGDFNGDGIPDLALAVSGVADSVAIALGNGDGTFQPFTSYTGGSGFPLSLVTTDLNGDGILDLVMGGGSGTTVWLGKGDGSFGPATSYLTGLLAYNSATVVDLNGDGKPDIAVASQEGPIAMLLGNGDGTFQQPVYFQGAVFPQTITFGDFNGDGAMDLALSVYGGITVGSGAFVSLQTNGPAVSFSQADLLFPTQLVGTRAVQSVVMTNVGKESLDITHIGTSGAGRNAFKQTNDCGSSVAVGASCTIHVAFVPDGRGVRKASLDVTDNAINHQQSIPMRGVGTWVTLTPTRLSFGSQKVGTTSPPQQVQLTNVGNTGISISQIVIGGSGLSDFAQTNTCEPGIGAGASCTISVTFKPLNRGNHGAFMLIYDNGGGSPQTIIVRGIGT